MLDRAWRTCAARQSHDRPTAVRESVRPGRDRIALQVAADVLGEPVGGAVAPFRLLIADRLRQLYRTRPFRYGRSAVSISYNSTPSE
jgi:hypothetical protein